MITEIGAIGDKGGDLNDEELLSRIKAVKKKYQAVIESNKYLGRLMEGA
jgi:hypothetical protein